MTTTTENEKDASVGTCTQCGVRLSAMNRVVGTRLCIKCVDGESASHKLGRLLARMLGAVMALSGLVSDSRIGLAFMIIGLLAVYYGFRTPKPAPNSLKQLALDEGYRRWFAGIEDLTEEKIRAIPIRQSNGILIGRALAICVFTFLGGRVSFGMSLVGCLVGLALTTPVLARATPLDRLRWGRFGTDLSLVTGLHTE